MFSPSKPAIDDVATQDIRKTLVFECPAAPKELRKIEKPTVHLIPCKVRFSGPAAVSTYFKVEPVPSSSSSSSSFSGSSDSSRQLYRAAFRGRQVTGHKITFADDCIGVVLQDKNSSSAMSGFSSSLPSSGSSFSSSKSKDVAGSSSTSGSNNSRLSAAKVDLTSRFDHMYVWNKDERKNDNQHIDRAFNEFMVLSSALHGEDDEEVNSDNISSSSSNDNTISTTVTSATTPDVTAVDNAS